MSFDVPNADHVAGGEGVVPLPIYIEGLFVSPSELTQSSQAAGDDTTILVARHSKGRVRIFGVVKDFPAAETLVVNDGPLAGGQYNRGGVEFILGNAVWFAQVAVQHRNAGPISMRYVPGTIAPVATAVKLSHADVVAYLGLSPGETVVITGQIRFHRSADTVIDVQTTDIDRPAYTDTTKKTGYIADVTDPTTLGEEFWGYLDVPVDLTSLSAVAAGSLYLNGLPLPPFAYGGKIAGWEYIPTVAGAGGGAAQAMALQKDGVVMTTSALALTLANTAVGVPVAGTAPTALNTFKTGETLDIELDVDTTNFTAGSGIIRIAVNKFIS